MAAIKAKTIDMTRGDPLRLILRFAIPLLLGNLFQQLYNMADGIIVGQFIGTDAFAAVGATGSVSFLIIGFILGCSSGFCIPVSQYFGAGDSSGMRRCTANILWIGIAVAGAVTALMMFTTRPLLTLMDTPENIFEDSFRYIYIIFAGIPACMFYNVQAGLMRAVGDSRSPLYFLIISCAINVILDLVFIAGLSIGVKGAALATIISQLISGILCFIWIIRKFPMLHPHGAEWKPDISLIRRLISIALPMGFQFSITAIGAVILQSAVNTLGSDIIASISAASKIQNIVFAPMETLGLTMATYCGQNLGAGRIDRIRLGVRRCVMASLILSVLCCLFVTFCSQWVALLYIKPEETEILANITYYLRVCGLFYIPLALIFVFRNSIQGMGFGVPAMAAGLFELAARAIVAICFVRTVGFTAAILANTTAWIAADVFLIPMYIYVIRKFTKNPPSQIQQS
ncbi:MAG: MATE family efflux transporter [Ruminococcaceae bacterium]|nr:MATE family efflux transporter [Oscillospiraceae bacterium]